MGGVSYVFLLSYMFNNRSKVYWPMSSLILRLLTFIIAVDILLLN